MMHNLALPIILIGFMGSGKTTVGRALAALINRGFDDLDHRTTARTGRTPQQIIDVDGEAAFREIETATLRLSLDLSRDHALVIALGGGAWTIAENRRLIHAHNSHTVWLNAPFELCWKRIAATGTARPLARNENQARKLYEERQAGYRFAQYHIEINPTLTAHDLAGIIAARLKDSNRKLAEGTDD